MAKKIIDRRDFMKALSVGLAGGYIGLKTGDSLAGTGGGGMGGGGMGGGGTSVINPPPGAAFADPPTLLNDSLEPGVVEVNIEARVSTVNVNGVISNLLTYKGRCDDSPSLERCGDSSKDGQGENPRACDGLRWHVYVPLSYCRT